MNATKPLVSEATDEQILSDVSYWEDISSCMMMITDDDEGTSVHMNDYENFVEIQATTIRGCLIEMMIAKHLKSPPYSDKEFTCDWSEVWKENGIEVR